MNKLFNIIFVLFLVLLFGLTYYTFPWADDYGSYSVMRSENVWEHSLNLYNHWDGRCISPEFIFSFFTYKYLPLKLTISIKLFFFIGSLLLILKTIAKGNALLSATLSVLIIVFFVGLKSSVAEVIFWVCGPYIYSFFGLSIFFYFISLNKIQYAVFLSFFLGLAGPNNFLISFGIFGFKLLYDSIIYRKLRLTHLMYLIPSVFGFLIILVAPGNANRGFDVHELGLVDVIVNIYRGYFHFIKLFFYDIRYLIILSGLFSLLFPNKTNLLSNSIGKEIVGLLVILFLSIIPYAIAGIFTMRSLWPNALILFLLLQNIGYLLISNSSYIQMISKSQKVKIWSFVFISILFVSYLGKQHYYAHGIYENFIARENFIKAQAIKGIDTLCIDQLDFTRRSIIHSSKDISEIEYLNFIGEGMEQYYGVDSLYICESSK